MLPPSFHTSLFLKYLYPVLDVDWKGGENSPRRFSFSFLLRSVQSPLVILFFLLVSRFLNLYSLEIYPGIYRIQLAVQGVKGGSLGGLSGPAVHHDAVNILRTAGWTGQPKPRRQQVQYFLVAFSWKGRDVKQGEFTDRSHYSFAGAE